MSEAWKIESRRNLVDSPWLKVEAQCCRTAKGTVIDPFYAVWQPDWVLVIAISSTGLVPMVRQYRHGVEKVLLEFPAGIMDPGESPVATAQRELREETGWAGGDWQLLRSLATNPDRMPTYFHIVLALGAEPMGDAEPEESEDIGQQWLSLGEVESALKSGAVEQSDHLAAWWIWQQATKDPAVRTWLEKHGLYESTK